MRKKILIICAHADDEVLGVGGTIAKLTSAGHSVSVLFLADGEASRNLEQSELSVKVKDRQTDAQAAAEILAINELIFENFPDNKMDSVALLDIIKVVEKTIAELKPDVIYTHYAHDLNLDHRMCFQAVITASRPIRGNHYPKEIYSFEVNSSSEWTNGPRFSPNVYSDITDYLETKVRALNCYDEEMRDFPHPRSIRAVKSLAELRGSESGCEAAEGFICIRKIS